MLPTKNPKFQEYYAPAVATKQLWRLGVGFFILFVVYLTFPLLLFLVGKKFNLLPIVHTGLDMSDPISIIFMLFSFIGLFIAVISIVGLLHQRSLKSLLGPSIRSVSKNAFYGFAMICMLSGISIFIYSFIDPPTRQMDVSVWLSWMVFAIPLLIIQISSEELIFRGYFQQQLAARFDSRWIWYFLPSLLFGLLHYSPQMMGSNAWLVVANTTLFGLIAADLTVRTGNLGAALGMHFANNLFAMMIVTLDGALPGLGLYLTSVHVSDVEQIRGLLIFDFCLVVGLYGAFLYWVRNKAEL
ncbi:CPBP family intramembrane metalloprotease [Amylibacter sp. SFDW26]|uniref:CPBP family intramembrane glutamic endopeptidase n=1 Tax=Amylibacter sp. SFDW26 TaxID=2652722 RepID=UPI001261BA05|nr:type II CAAX endopeptidase family protein [Amylibacter sp. SFDW26]KAB7614613.1 CPBP family intramembrane metalloprotease [Amylibacter sp. SFDW26]